FSIVHFLSVRTCATSALISSSLNLSLKGFIFSLPSAVKPSLIAANILSSTRPAWYCASVWSLTPAMRPALVWPLPSLPWQEAQCFAQLAWTSAARDGLGWKNETNIAVRRSSFFMVLLLVGLCEETNCGTRPEFRTRPAWANRRHLRLV